MALLTKKFGSSTQIGTVVLDVEISFAATFGTDFSDERLATGSRATDHSERRERRYTIRGGVSQVPQNFTGAGADNFESNLAAIGGQAIDTLSPVDTNLNTRAADARDTLIALAESGEQFVYIGAGGKLLLVATELQYEESFDVGEAFVFTLQCKELRLGTVDLVTNPNELSGDLAGSGSTTRLGPTRTEASTVTLE